jgi:DNA-directed RNA polymerase subunit M/transcription elongation factor TFIIS
MYFCKECDNKMYPLEKDEKLFNKCNDCGFQEPFNGSIIEKKNYKKKNTYSSFDSQYLIYDNTLPRTIHKQCPSKSCQSKDNVSIFIQDPISLKLTYICSSCNVQWKYS